ncbi:hypothetical protein BV20DRAFT_954575 [Pilatotrama ljubarskyi]|nr:hypothetical protein BV20DRAFT_954575 [Pilatotrama ljubarskyi]
MIDLETRVKTLEEKRMPYCTYDGVGLPDYAPWDTGGRIIGELTSDTYAPQPVVLQRGWLWNTELPSPTNGLRVRPPEYAITPNMQLGSCWPMDGRNGTLGLSLSRPVFIRAFTVDHIPRSLTPLPESAPREVELWGSLDKIVDREQLQQLREDPSLNMRTFQWIRRQVRKPGEDQRTDQESDLFVLLGRMTYNVRSGQSAQTARIPETTIGRVANILFKRVLFVFLDNWGNDDYTCIYRVRIHGGDAGRTISTLPH